MKVPVSFRFPKEFVLTFLAESTNEELVEGGLIFEVQFGRIRTAEWTLAMKNAEKVGFG